MAEDLASQTALPASPHASPRPKASRTAEVVRRNADAARAAADRAKAKSVKNKNAGDNQRYDDYGDRD